MRSCNKSKKNSFVKTSSVPRSHGLVVKKQFGQHFLRVQSVVDHVVEKVTLTPESSVFEIGGGDGFLTRRILQEDIARLWVFEIDPEWAAHLQSTINDTRLIVLLENILDADFQRLAPYQPWTLLANLPYQITFPILHLLQRNRHLLKEGVVMVQEEVAQKIVQKRGRGYGYPALFFQHYFTWELMEKFKTEAFFPPPKVDSRLLYFKPNINPEPIPDEEQFWKFIKICFAQPRRTLRNNLKQLHYDTSVLSDDLLDARAQQLSMQDFLGIFTLLKAS